MILTHTLMIIRFLFSLFLLLTTIPYMAMAQGGKISTGNGATVPKTPTPNGPVSATSFQLPPGGLTITCQMLNGKNRPYACEFRVTSMGIGGGGTTIKNPAGFNPQKPVSLTLHIGKASQNAFVTDDIRRLTFSLVMTVPRVNVPSFSAPGGYPFLYYPKDVVAQLADVWKTQTPLVFDYVVATEPMAINVGQTQVLMLPIKFMVKKKAGGGYGFVPPNPGDPATATQTGTFYFVNTATAQATNTKASTANMSDVAEWWAKVTFVLVP
jgi:hypothetical protein